MMCRQCQQAGKLNQFSLGRQGDSLLTVSELHKRCEYPLTCTCEHKTGEHLQQGVRK